MDNILEVKNLSARFFLEEGAVNAVNDISFSLQKGENIAIVGESGSGKSVTALSIMRLIAGPGKITNGEIFFKGANLLKLAPDAMRGLRGNKISMIFQDPFTALNPVFTIGEQLKEAVMAHQKTSKEEAARKSIEMLKKVRIPAPERRMKNYPHELSGGMRQRVMIAMAILCNPEILIADEPTTALDVTIQAQILALLRELKKELQSSIILITHNLGIVAGFCERVIVMYAGSIMEEACLNDIFYNPKHPYTKALLKCLPSLTAEKREKLPSIKGSPPNLIDLPPGCPFAPRCDEVMEICAQSAPKTVEIGKEHRVKCWRYD